MNDNLSYSLTNVVSTNICIRNIQPYNAGHSLSLEWKSLGWHTFSVIKRDNSTLDPYPRQNFTINNKNSLFILKPDILSLTVIPNPRQFLNCLVTMDEDCDLITDDLKDSMVHSNYLRWGKHQKTKKKTKTANRGTNKLKGSKLQSLILFLHFPHPLDWVILWICFTVSQASPLLLSLPASTLTVVSVTSYGDSYSSNLVLCLQFLSGVHPNPSYRN